MGTQTEKNNPNKVNEEKISSSILNQLEDMMGFRTRILWENVLLMIAIHVFIPLVFFKYGFPVKWQTAVFNYIVHVVATFGVSGAVHRYWSHRSYSANTPLRVILMLSFALAGQKTIFGWVRDHRVHHKYINTDGDPTNIERGFFFAHFGWNMMKKHPKVIEGGKKIDMSDILNDPIVNFHDRNVVLVQILSNTVPILLAVALFGESLACATVWRWMIYFLGWHSTWAFNSFAHMFGFQPINRHIKAMDNFFMTLLVGDEGYHNYHHTFPWDYSTSELGYITSVSVTTPAIDAFHWLGWAYGLKKPSAELVATVASKRGDGSPPKIVKGWAGSQFSDHSHEEVLEDQDVFAKRKLPNTNF